jgi:hypothetical protein
MMMTEMDMEMSVYYAHLMRLIRRYAAGYIKNLAFYI